MPVEIKIECECGKLITKSNISTHKKSKIHNKNMLAIGTVEPQEFENTIICQEVKAVEPKVKVVKKTAVKKTSRKVKVSKKFLTAITKVINTKIIQISHYHLEITKPDINCEKLQELQTVISNCLNLIRELQEEIIILKQDEKIVETPENYFDNPEIDPVYRYTVWMQKQYFTNRVIVEIKRLCHPIFKGIDTVEDVVEDIVEDVVCQVVENVVEEVVEDVSEIMLSKTIVKKDPKPRTHISKSSLFDIKTYEKTKQKKKELKIQSAIATLFEEEFDNTKPYLCNLEYTDFMELKNYKTRITNALKWIDESLEDCFHLEYTYSIIYNTKKKEVYLHLTDNETGKLFVRLCETKIYFDTVSLYNKPNPRGEKFTVKKIDKPQLVVMFEKIKGEIKDILLPP
jgi:hypothetical protein